MKHKKYDFRTAFIDLLINVLTGMVFLFMITTLMIQTKVTEEEKGIKKDAQYVATITWPTDINCDVDIWVKDPQKNVVSYQSKDIGVMHLERDDMGWTNDAVIIDGSLQLDNTETWVLRGKLPGKFTFNIHLYSCAVDNKPLPLGSAVNVPVKVEIIRLNPSMNKFYNGSVTLTRVWQEITVLSFVLDGNNTVTSTSTDQVDLVKEKDHTSP